MYLTVKLLILVGISWHLISTRPHFSYFNIVYRWSCRRSQYWGEQYPGRFCSVL